MKRLIVVGGALALVFLGIMTLRDPAPAEVLVAAASDLSFPIREIIAEFEERTGHSVTLSLGSSGNFYTQISNGAPFDVFMSADLEYIRQLERRELVEPESVLLYAVGRIVLWAPNTAPFDVRQLGMNALTHPSSSRIAIANPEHAPYGRAAVAAMKHFGLYEEVSSRLVLGENISQAAQFVSSGAADIGVIALSVAMADAMRSAGTYWEVPLDAYPQMDQGMAVLKRARSAGHYEAARAFRDWMAGENARAALRRYGFSLPGVQ